MLFKHVPPSAGLGLSRELGVVDLVAPVTQVAFGADAMEDVRLSTVRFCEIEPGQRTTMVPRLAEQTGNMWAGPDIG